jgi:hypothetical protein
MATSGQIRKSSDLAAQLTPAPITVVLRTRYQRGKLTIRNYLRSGNYRNMFQITTK